MSAYMADGSKIMDDNVPANFLATAVDAHVETMESLEKVKDELAKAVASRKVARQEAAVLREKIAEFLTDGLVAIAGAVCTPEAGYLVDGGLWGFLADVKALRKQHDQLLDNRK